MHVSERNREGDFRLLSDWERLFGIREDVFKSPGRSPDAKSRQFLEASVVISAAGETYDLLDVMEITCVLIHRFPGRNYRSEAEVQCVLIRFSPRSKSVTCWNYSTRAASRPAILILRNAVLRLWKRSSGKQQLAA